MTDIASVGFAVDSSQVESATASLKNFGTAATGAAQGANTFNSAAKLTDGQTRALQASADRLGISFDEMVARFRAAPGVIAGGTSAMSQHAKMTDQVTRANAQAMRATNDNNVAIGGLTNTANNSNTAFDRLANTITRRFIAALVVKEIRDFTQYLIGLNTAIANTADSAERAGVSYQKFQGLTTAAGYKGITSDTFGNAMLDFNKQVDLAKDGLGTLKSLLAINGKTVSDTATTLGTVADLVKKAATEAQKLEILQDAGLPANREFAKLMEQGAAGINSAAIASTKLTDQQMNEAKRINDAWNKMWTDFENWGKRAIVNTLGSISSGGQQPVRVQVYAPWGGQSDDDAAKSLQRQKDLIALEQARITAMTKAPTVEQLIEAARKAANTNTQRSGNDVGTQRRSARAA
ncbi:MAG: hypothetical protein HXX15_21150 [Rhodopseudomonas sp.]|uniref:hypothetical protein n=1 Tax=Rhodopseudomonas sp. TaxID=1078 RepID=UPI0017B8DEB9|nr:hypothetical protein [Rhodopseudomonas sp.]NVN88594.1 hypothetical protein [Rhodopseudomonas sp.]